MGLVARRSAALPNETWPNMYAAAQERFWDALTLACSDLDRGSGAIYLLGYVAEALLKTAYCQFNLLPSNGNMYAALQSTGQKNLHSLTGLLNLLINARSAGNNPNPMDPAIAGAATTYVLTIEQHWQVKLRYFDFPATVSEVNDMLTSVEGHFSLYRDLWN